jgi:cobalt/nickel transport system permease protein
VDALGFARNGKDRTSNVSHLHIPDGVLPPLVWIVGALLAVLALAWSLRVTRAQGPREIAFQSALGGIMLAVMAIPVPITAFDYCMTLAGPVGVLLGAAGAFQASFVVTVILALMGQGGFSVIGLNTLVLGTGAALARPLYVALVRRWSPAASMAAATAVSQLFSSALWVGILVVSVRVSPSAVREHEVAHALTWLRGGALLAVLLPLMGLAVAIESLLGFGLARFLDRVRPDLLPGRRSAPAAEPASDGAA